MIVTAIIDELESLVGSEDFIPRAYALRNQALEENDPVSFALCDAAYREAQTGITMIGYLK